MSETNLIPGVAAAQQTRVERQAIEIPEPPDVGNDPSRTGKYLKLLRSFGPAAVLTSLSVGAGETIMVTGLGAWAGYDLLWVLVASILVKSIFVTYFIGRYTAITGQLFTNRLAMLPGPRGWLVLALVGAEFCLMPMGLTVLAKPCGNLLTFVTYDYLPAGSSFWVWENAWASVLLAAALGTALFSSYFAIERQQIVICGILVGGTLVAMAIVGPSWGKLVQGAVSFGAMPTAPQWAPQAARETYFLNLITVFGYVGGSLSGYLAYSQWISLHGWGLSGHPDIASIRAMADRDSKISYLPFEPAQARRMSALLQPMRWDIGLGALVLLVVTAAFMTAGAEVLYPRRMVLSGNAFELLTKQGYIWRQVHEGLVPVYYVVVVAALWGTLATVPEAICRVAHNALCVVWPRLEAISLWNFQAAVSVWLFLAGLAWIWTGITFDLLTQIGAFVTLSLGVGIVSAAAVYFNATLPKLYRPHVLVLAGGVVSSGILLLCAVVSGVSLVQQLLIAWQR